MRDLLSVSKKEIIENIEDDGFFDYSARSEHAPKRVRRMVIFV